MSFSAYPEYRESGVEWLDKVPAHWQQVPLWTLFTRVKRTGFGGEELLSVYRDYGVIPKSSRDDNFNKASDDLSAYQLVEPGDLAINKMKAWQGSVAISQYRGIVSPAYHIYSSVNSESSRYLHHLFRSKEYISGYLANSKGIRVNQWDLEPQQHSRMPVLLPPLAEQFQIARFLDHETVKIDALIQEQEGLIELLQEKRQAVISHAVTKGLDPDVPMKDSGVEWLGEGPAHWTIRKGSYIGRLFGSDPVPESMVLEEGRIPFLKVASLSASNIDVSSWDWFVSSEYQGALRPAKNFIVFPKRGAAIFLNKVNVVNRKAVIDPNLMGWEISEGHVTEFYAHVLKCRGLSELADVSTVPQINNKHVAPEMFPVPPVEEQRGIVRFLETRIQEMERLNESAKKSIELLMERRSALISAAVTGKIDVRNWQPPIDESAFDEDVHQAGMETTA